MAAGDATRVWFKDVDAVLISRWRDTLSGEGLAALAGELTATVTRLREQQGILPQVIYCPECRTSARAKPPVILGGGVIFAAKRLGLIGDAQVTELQTLWRRYSAPQRRAGVGRAKDRDWACGSHN